MDVVRFFLIIFYILQGVYSIIRFFYWIFLQMSKRVLPIEDSFPKWGRAVLQKIMEKFEKHKLSPRAKDCPFKQLFTTLPFRFLGALIYRLLLWKIQTKKKHEMQFSSNGNWLRFKLGEFALATDLDCSAPLSSNKLKENSVSINYWPST